MTNIMKRTILVCGLILGVAYTVPVPSAEINAQTITCVRPDISSAEGPDTIESVQPSLSNIRTTLDNESSERGFVNWVLRAMAKHESGWHQVDLTQEENTSGCFSGAGQTACTCASSGGDYGIMQINWSAHNSTISDWDRIQTDYEYNIDQSARILNQNTAQSVNTGDLTATGEPINWYLKLWGYNGWGAVNNPGNVFLFPKPDRNWDENNIRRNCKLEDDIYTYQETILYTANCESVASDSFTGDIETWPSIGAFPLPDDTLFRDMFNAGIHRPPNDMSIFDVSASNNCPEDPAIFHYTTTQPNVTTQIVIHDKEPWDTSANVLTILPEDVNRWDGRNSSGSPLPEAQYWFTVEVRDQSDNLVGLQSFPFQLTCSKTDTYLPLITKVQATPTPSATATPSIVCEAETILLEDSFETGDPFTGLGTSSDNVPWSINLKKNVSGTPFPVHPNKYGIGGEENAIRLGIEDDNDNPPDDRTDNYDQAVYRSLFVPKNTKRLQIEFRVLLETLEPIPFPSTPTVPENDFFYFGFLESSGSDGEVNFDPHASANFKCSNRVCNRTNQPNQVEVGWFTLTPGYDEVHFIPSLSIDTQYLVGFVSNVNVSAKSTFSVDRITIKILECDDN